MEKKSDIVFSLLDSMFNIIWDIHKIENILIEQVEGPTGHFEIFYILRFWSVRHTKCQWHIP